jgi:GNAT superfamily N-acetyltransferase
MLGFDTRENPLSKSDAFTLRKATEADIPAMVALSHYKRRSYEKAQPQFWRYAAHAEEIQDKWFRQVLDKDDYILLVVEAKGQIRGFVLGYIISAPEVYDPGGLTLMVDDFCIETPALWEEVGSKLLIAAKEWAKGKGAAQAVVVAGCHDEPKRQFLKSMGLGAASEWYVGGME